MGDSGLGVVNKCPFVAVTVKFLFFYLLIIFILFIKPGRS